MVPDHLTNIFISGWDNPYGDNPYEIGTDEWDAYDSGQSGAHWDRLESDDWQSA